MAVVDSYRLVLKDSEYVPIIIGGMGVDISTSELALEACRLGGIGHISDAMSPYVSDKLLGTRFCRNKLDKYKDSLGSLDKTHVKFDPEALRSIQRKHVEHTMRRKKGKGAIFVNVMEKLTMGAPAQTLEARLNGALDAGIDGITLSAGLHMHSMKLMETHPRFRDAAIGIIVSSVRALKIFLRGAERCNRLPDYIVVEGPLAGGHLGFGLEDWKEANLKAIVNEVMAYLKENSLNIAVIPAGGVFTGTDAVDFLEMGASAVQVATRFAISKEGGYPFAVKQKLFRATEEDVVVTNVSPTGYPLRMLTSSPCLESRIRPQCERFGYLLDGDGACQYIQWYTKDSTLPPEERSRVVEKACLCHHFSRYNCYTCGHYVYRLKDVTNLLSDGTYQLPRAEEIFHDYQFSEDGEVKKPAIIQEAAIQETLTERVAAA